MSEHITQQDTNIDHHLSHMASHYLPSGFIAGKIFPTVQVPKQSAHYVVYDKKDLFRREPTKRSRGVEATKIDWRLSKSAYHCKNYALKADVTVEDRANSDILFLQRFEEGRVMRVQDALYLDWESRVAELITESSSITSTPVTNKWNVSAAKPLDDILKAMNTVENATGYRPNRILFSGKSWVAFRQHQTVINRTSTPGTAGSGHYPSLQEAQDLLEMEVLVGNAWQQANQSGLEQVWGNHVLVYYAPDHPSIEAPSFGYYFRWAAHGLPNMQVERHPYDSRRHCHEVEIGYYQDEVITSPALGSLLKNTL